MNPDHILVFFDLYTEPLAPVELCHSSLLVFLLDTFQYMLGLTHIPITVELWDILVTLFDESDTPLELLCMHCKLYGYFFVIVVFDDSIYPANPVKGFFKQRPVFELNPGLYGCYMAHDATPLVGGCSVLM